MRLALFCFVLCLLLPGSAPADDGWAIQEQSLIQRLRQSGAASRAGALKDLQALPGYPASARFAIPILVWMQSDEDVELRSRASAVLDDLKWPQDIDLRGARAFASRQDATYQLMATKALVQVAEREPEALLLLLQVCRGRFGSVADFASAQGALLLRRPCRSQRDADAWAEKAVPFLAAFQVEFSHPSWRSRPFLALLDSCGGWHGQLAAAARDALKRTPLRQANVP